MDLSRRSLVGAMLATCSTLVGFANKMVPKTGRRRPIRPPGAILEATFLQKCIRCFQCGEICPNHCIKFSGVDDGLTELGTPFIDPRTRGCTACMKCNQVCPSGALEPQSADLESIPGNIKMGVARLNRDMCYSWAEPARTCGVCYRACPFPGVAMSITIFERPIVHPQMCIGCGLCEQACIHLPQAIRIVPVDGDSP